MSLKRVDCVKWLLFDIQQVMPFAGASRRETSKNNKMLIDKVRLSEINTEILASHFLLGEGILKKQLLKLNASF